MAISSAEAVTSASLSVPADALATEESVSIITGTELARVADLAGGAEPSSGEVSTLSSTAADIENSGSAAALSQEGAAAQALSSGQQSAVLDGLGSTAQAAPLQPLVAPSAGAATSLRDAGAVDCASALDDPSPVSFGGCATQSFAHFVLLNRAFLLEQHISGWAAANLNMCHEW